MHARVDRWRIPSCTHGRPCMLTSGLADLRRLLLVCLDDLWRGRSSCTCVWVQEL